MIPITITAGILPAIREIVKSRVRRITSSPSLLRRPGTLCWAIRGAGRGDPTRGVGSRVSLSRFSMQNCDSPSVNYSAGLAFGVLVLPTKLALYRPMRSAPLVTGPTATCVGWTHWAAVWLHQ